MVSVRGLVPLVVLVFTSSLLLAVRPARAQGLPVPRPAPAPRAPHLAPLIGATEVVKLTTPVGFIDDVVTADEQRLAYVVAVTGSTAELHVYTHATQQEQVVDLAPITLRPVALSLVGTRVFVVGKTEDGQHTAGMIELAGRGKARPPGPVAYTLGPANAITLITRAGKPRIVVHKASTTPTGTRHDVELVAFETGRRIAAGRPFELDTTDRHDKLQLQVNHWSDGMSRAHGIKAGTWDRKENQRAPDVEATYDLVASKILETRKIEDLFEQRRRFQALASQGARDGLDFLLMTWDNAAIQLWRAGKSSALELDQPLTSYDPKSMQGVVQPDGSAWIALKVDPVNAEAVARKKADPEYLDIFRAGPDGKALRTARVLGHGARHRFGVVGARFWLIERTSGFERGGRSLTLYQPQ